MNKSLRVDQKKYSSLDKYLAYLLILVADALLTIIIINEFEVVKIGEILLIAGAVLIPSGGAVFLYGKIINNNVELFENKKFKSNLAYILVAVALVAILYPIKYILVFSSEVIAGKVSTGSAVSFGIIFSFAFGLILFLVRLKFRGWYGFFEMMVGVFIVGHKIYSANSSVVSNIEFYLAVLTTGLYLIVRGMDNIHQWYEGRNPIESEMAKT